MYLFFTFLFGSVLFSFACCMADRILDGEDFIHGRSHCGHCRHVLSWTDTIPVVSYLLYRGRCRYCGERIPVHVFLWESGGGVLAVCMQQWCTGSPLHRWIMILYCAILMVMSRIDRRTLSIPVFLQYGIAVLGALDCLTGTVPLPERLVFFLVPALPLWIICRLRPVLGRGDIRLRAWRGFLLGRQIIAAFVLSMWAGAAVCIILRKRKLAYVPLFLAGFLPTVAGLIDPLVLLYLPK